MATPTNTPSTNGEAARTPGHGLRTIRGVMRPILQARAQVHAPSTLRRQYVRPRASALARGTHTSTNIALAGLQLLVGYQWLVSGVDKMLLGSFPTQMSQLLAEQSGSGKLPGYVAALLHALVVPNARVFGYAIMLGETLAGLGLVAAGLLALLRPLAEAHLRGRLWHVFAPADRLVTGLAVLAAAGAGLLGVGYYLLDGAPPLWFTPSLAYGGAIAPSMVLALASLVLVVAQVVRVRTGR